MFRLGKRWFLLTIQIAAVATTVGLGLYQYLVPANAMKWRFELAFLAAILVLTACGAYYTYISPVRELKTFVTAVLDNQAQHIVDCAKANNVDIRLNIAIVSIYPFQLSYPFKRFKIVWDYGMKYAPDAASTFPVSKGVAGEAYRRRRDRLVDMEIPRHQNLENWGFSKKEASCFPPFTAIWSLPVFRLGAGDRPTTTICGMLNLDSTTAGAFQMLTTHPEIRTLLEEKRELLCKLNL